MPDPHCFGSLDACAIRVAELTASGSPFTGADHGYVSNGFTKIDVSVNLVTGDSKDLKNGCGDICQTFTQPDTVKSVKLAMDLCQIDADLISLLCGGNLFTSGGDTIGYQYPAVGIPASDGVCFEVWTKAWDASQQATTPEFGANAVYIHWVFPRVKWHIGNHTMQHDIMVMALDGVGEENSQITADGPYDDWDPGVAAGGGITRIGGWFFDDVLPTPECDFIEVTSAAS